jgi:hypothetical protein
LAKGNDGDYFQHSVEVAVAVHLTRLSTRGDLHIALTHGMAPFESCDPPSGQPRRLLEEALQAAQNSPICGEPPIIVAYRATKASREHYPNTGELLAAMIGRDLLSGGITEKVPHKHAELADVWSGSGVTPINSSWRCEVGAGGVLSCPATLCAPWLFSADPMTFREEGYEDDGNLYGADLSRVSTTLKGFIASGQPGVAAFFVYSVKPGVRIKFWEFADNLAADLAANSEKPMSCWVTHRGGNRNLAALLCSGVVLPACWLPHGVHTGR